MSKSRTTCELEADNIVAARSRWLVTSEHASKLSAKLFQLGSGHGEPDTRLMDEQ
jgi:hypothetical protein